MWFTFVASGSFSFYLVQALKLWEMRKGGCMYFVAELSGPVLSEACVYLLMCCGTGSNTAVPPMLRAGSVGRSSALLGEHSTRWHSPEGSACCVEEIYHSKRSLISKGNGIIHSTLSQSVKDCFDSTFKLHTKTLTRWLWKAGVVTWREIKLLVVYCVPEDVLCYSGLRKSQLRINL